MKCPYCSHKLDQTLDLCPYCKASLKNTAITLDAREDKIIIALKSKLFLAICILSTLSFVLPIFKANFPVFDLLYTIFLWRAYIAADSYSSVKNRVKTISGMVYAEYVVTCVVSIIMLVLGLITAFLISVMATDNFSNLMDIMSQLDYGFISLFLKLGVIQKTPALFFALLFVGISLVTLIPNLIWRIKIHYFLKSTHQSIDDKYVKIEYAKEAKNALIILSVISLVISILISKSIISFVGELCNATTYILGAILINKYFVLEK